MNKEYEEQLKDPRWKLKRKVILERDEHRCMVCGSKRWLNVHHTYYSGGYMAWEYPDDSLMTLCRDCHKKWHEEHEIEYKSHPEGKPERPIKRKPRVRKRRRRGKNKPSRLFLHATRKPRICLAVIQANRDDYVKLKDGTWVRKKFAK